MIESFFATIISFRLTDLCTKNDYELITWRKQFYFFIYLFCNDKGKIPLYTAHVLAWNPRTYTLCSQKASKTAPHKAEGCVFIMVLKHSVEFRVHQLWGCQPEWNSHYPRGRSLCQTIFFCHPPMIEGLFKIKALAKQQFSLPSFQKYSIWRMDSLVRSCLPI